MSVQTFSIQMRQVSLGNGLLVLCGILYLLWWVLAFRPSHPVGAVSGFFLVGAFVAGMIGLVFMVKGIGGLEVENQPISQITLIVTGAVMYFVLLFVTYALFHRQITSELFLFTAWAVLELAAVNALYGVGKFTLAIAISYCIVIAIAFIVSLVCYVLYYRLSGMAGYIDGMIPLICETAAMIYFAIVLLVVSS